MKTVVTDSPREASEFIIAGETAAFPTETVYGLGADAFDASAVRKIFVAKARPSDNPIIVHVFDRSEVDLVVSDVSAAAGRLMDAFFPGPLTLVLPKRPSVPDEVTAGLETVGIRVPSHPVARAFLEACRRPVAAPSANRSGRPSPTTWQAVLDDLEGRIPCVLKGGRSSLGLESTVVDCTTDHPAVLRAGAVSVAQLRDVVPEMLDPEKTRDTPVRSPGMRHRHYAPTARVAIVARPPARPLDDSAYIGLHPPSHPDRYRLRKIASTLEEYAHELFDFMRRCDAAGINVIYCERVESVGLGYAIMDRLRRASGAN